MSTTRTAEPDAATTTAGAAPTAAPSAIDTEVVDAFAQRVFGVIADASTALMLSIGHRTGLFDVLQTLAPSTSERIAQVARLQERYVREWLAGMLVGGVVEHDAAAGTWWLPEEHAAVLTRAAGPDNLARLAQFVGLLAGVEHDVVRCFHEGGGVPYSAFAEFHALMGEDSKDVAESLLLSQVVPLVDGLADRLEQGVDVADVGCGSGHHLRVLASAYPRSRFVGYDFSDEAIGQATETAGAHGLTNLRFEVRDVVDLAGTGPFDLVTAFDAIHDQAQPATVLAGIADVLAPGGVFLMGDIRASSHPHENVHLPAAPFLYAVSLMHCMTVSLAQGGEGLGAAWGEQTAVRMLREAGFDRVEVHQIEGDPINSYYVARDPGSARP